MTTPRRLGRPQLVKMFLRYWVVCGAFLDSGEWKEPEIKTVGWKGFKLKPPPAPPFKNHYTRKTKKTMYFRKEIYFKKKTGKCINIAVRLGRQEREMWHTTGTYQIFWPLLIPLKCIFILPFLLQLLLLCLLQPICHLHNGRHWQVGMSTWHWLVGGLTSSVWEIRTWAFQLSTCA